MLTIYRTGKIVSAIGEDVNGYAKDAPCEFECVEEAESFYQKMQGCNSRYELTVEYFKVKCGVDKCDLCSSEDKENCNGCVTCEVDDEYKTI